MTLARSINLCPFVAALARLEFYQGKMWNMYLSCESESFVTRLRKNDMISTEYLLTLVHEPTVEFDDTILG
jgi:hypothetical protein